MKYSEKYKVFHLFFFCICIYYWVIHMVLSIKQSKTPSSLCST